MAIAGPWPKSSAKLTSRRVAGAVFVSALAGDSWTREAKAQFLEADVEVIRLFEGEEAGDNFGWVGANLQDLDGDLVQEILIPAIGSHGNLGRVTLFSGALGGVLSEVVSSNGPRFGYSVAPAGDVNADGTGDYIVGGGQVLVFSGRNHEVLLDVTPITGFGSSVSEAGDINGDGYGDIAVGNQLNSTATTSAGRVFALSGKDGSILWTRDGLSSQDRFGSALGFVGDVDGDSVGELSVGAAGAGDEGGGRAYLVHGQSGTIMRRFDPIDPSEAVVFGEFFASGAGDIDRDGVPDVFVGDYAEGRGPRSGTGRAYIFSGRTGGPIHVFTGFRPGDGLGPGRGIPDVNGDGYRDVIVAAYRSSVGAPTAGAAYLFSGRSGALLRTMTATREADNFGVDAFTVGDVNGDELPDYVVTAVGLSFNGQAPGRAYLIAGTLLPCVEDVNRNGFVGLFDLIRIRRSFGAGAGEADLDGDGRVDLSDLVIALKAWGPCPSGRPRR